MKNLSSKLLKLGRVFIYSVFIVVCILPLFYFGVWRISDYFVCRSIISLKLGLGLSPFTLENHIQVLLVPGMTREEVKASLEKIGKVIVKPAGASMNLATDHIELRICSHPMNNITLGANYAVDGLLYSIKIYDD